MTHIPLHDMDRHAGVEQVGGLSVTHPVGALEVDRRAGGVGDLQRGGQLGEQPVQGVSAVVALAGALQVTDAAGSRARTRARANSCCSFTMAATSAPARMACGAPAILVCW